MADSDDLSVAVRHEARCHDCFATRSADGTMNGFKKAERWAARHVEDGWDATPCGNTKVYAVYEDGEKRVA